MSTPNFCTMPNFPLYIRDFVEEVGFCPACTIYQGYENVECEICGGQLETRTLHDDAEASYVCSEIERCLEDMNGNFLFHEITLESGYYYGVQFLVKETHNPNEYDNEDCQYYFDMYRSVAIRRYQSEINKVNKVLCRLAEEFDFEKFYCRAVFSNGEAIYERADDTSRSKIRQAVSSVCC